jgi:hypothetical protein
MSNFKFQKRTIFWGVIATVKARPVLKPAWQELSKTGAKH